MNSGRPLFRVGLGANLAMRVGRLSLMLLSACCIASAAAPIFAADQAVASAVPASRSADDFGYGEVRLINDYVAQAWKDHGLVPSEAASDGEWCRRVHLDLVGRVPTVAELRNYLADRKHEKRQRVGDRPLSGED